MSDKAIGTLVLEDANAAIQYAGCQSKHAEVTSLYEQARQTLIEFRDKLRRKEEEE